MTAANAPSATAKVFNFVAFQGCWFACVLGAAHGRTWLGPVSVGVALSAHLALAAAPARQALMIAAVAAAGYATDSLLAAAGSLRFGGGAPAPLWIAALWLGFASTLDSSMRWLRRRYLIAAGLGALAGPLCYLAGAELGALASPQGVGLLAIAVAWGAVLPLGLWIVERSLGDRAR